ncbi:MAG: RluA family pseudouridine synthase [Deltaproteobacteria bacterium]|nr:RluA family pseudouridine synthase [Deltaproteobacteria bacterium]
MSGITARRHRFQVPAELDGERLDRVVAGQIDELSRRRARVVIDLGGVFVDGKRVKVASRPMRTGQQVEVVVGGALERATKKVGSAARRRDDRRLPDHRIVFQDEHLAVVFKPAGLLTAPTPESDRGNLADLLGRELGSVFVVHRLDLPTSGILVFARTNQCNQALGELFRVHDVDRRYRVVVEGYWPAELVRIDVPVAGKEAVTEIEVIERIGDRATVLQATLHTGRTHQIRVHVSGSGHPVAGDRRYGGKTLRPPQMALHATRLGFRHPVTGESLCFDEPIPVDLDRWLSDLRGAG